MFHIRTVIKELKKKEEVNIQYKTLKNKKTRLSLVEMVDISLSQMFSDLILNKGCSKIIETTQLHVVS